MTMEERAEISSRNVPSGIVCSAAVASAVASMERAIAQSDVFRASAIGVAPLLLGFLLLGFGSRYIFGESASWKSISNTFVSWRGIVAVYGGLSISQLMWTSKSDRQEWFTALVLLVGVGASVYFLFGVPTISFVLPSVLSTWMHTLFTSIIHGAWFVAGINTVMISLLILLLRQKRRELYSVPPTGFEPVSAP